MGFGSHYVTSFRFCFPTEDYNEWMNKHFLNTNDDYGKKILNGFIYYIVVNVKKNRVYK